ncbi:sortase [Candidatus Shapirobacteria bacterium]|nr:sortase [Candidatus Shapirobacteria bacterium]
MLYCYVKREPKLLTKSPWAFLKYLPLALLLAGIGFLASVVWPILNYELKSQQFARQLISPVEILGESTTVVDYSRVSTWFPTAPSLPPQPSKITHYTLSIPKLKIENAIVHIGGEDLMESLIQYPGTALPGQYGNTVIFGHSVLPQFFNPKNYKTIFSTLPTIKVGDEILVDFDGIQYRYEVVNLREVSPDDVSVLEQRYEAEYLTLITCVPPGTYLKRLIVSARLVRF